jgi:hypothetical protein
MMKIGNPPSSPFTKGGIVAPPFGKREARRDFKGRSYK